ncbi:MAG: gliding motility lipoprotein GldD [Bacteroidetes bacterium]|nr:gliding motility lipoprotein GldD [Bacteroidota bacterium]
MTGLTACNHPTVPKPRGFFRIDFPEKKYVRFDSLCPFSFDYPGYSRVIPYRRDLNSPFYRFMRKKNMLDTADFGKCWFNIEFPVYKASLHLSYHPVNNNLQQFVEDARGFVYKHTVRADAINEKPVLKTNSKVYGIIYDIEGNTASASQFFVTDSSAHFVRAALYFNIPPQADSLQPVIDFIRRDIYYMVESWEWK